MLSVRTIACVLALFTIATSIGQDSCDAKTIEQLIAQLDHKSFKVRQEATEKLRRGSPSTRAHLLRALKDNGLSLEARRRVRQIADELLAFRELGAFRDPNDLRERLGYDDHIFFIDNDADHKRYKRIMPALPEVNLKARMLLVAISCDGWPRRFLPPKEDGATLVIRVEQGELRRKLDHGKSPPSVVVAEVITWSGPIRLEVNGKEQFTRWTGKRRDEEAARQWQEIRRLHGGADPTRAQRIAAIRRRAFNTTDDADVRLGLLSSHEMKGIYEMEFRRLVDMRATGLVPDIFKLLEGMDEFDEAAEGAVKALAAFGTPEVVEGCAKAIKSKNPLLQRRGLQIAWSLKDPALRAAFLHAMTERSDSLVRSGLVCLKELGLTKDDVPALVAVLERGDTFFEDNVGVAGYAAFCAGSLGADAAAALPALEKLQSHRLLSVQAAAATAIEKIKTATRAP